MSYHFRNEKEQEAFERMRGEALACGFSKAELLDCSTIRLLPEVRKMCEANTCGMYGKNWACPPGCGDLDSCRKRVEKYRFGLLVQTIGDVEDSLDFEGMQEAERHHKEAFLRANAELKKAFPGLLALGAGCCTVCQSCTCPDGDCRFPEKRISSMESYGILVSGLCSANGLGYYYGPEKIAYTSCYLLS